MHHASLKVALALSTALVATSVHAGWVTPKTSGLGLMYNCSPETTCQVQTTNGANPGGYRLLNARSTPVVLGGVMIGRVLDRVWRSRSDNTQYVFGTRVVLNRRDWSGSGLPYAIDDIFRYGFSASYPLETGWRRARASDLRIEQVGRTAIGTNQGIKTYDLTVVDFAVPLIFPDNTPPDDDDDEEELTIAEDPDEGVEPEEEETEEEPRRLRSAWLYIRTTATGYELGTDSIRLWNAGSAEGQPQESLWFNGFRPTF
ncbi:hypothetical protein [Methyloversatilis sp.]|uniref:hypothetical protein n=1 Tax=Methyloversatilis sp. TaxID=2569862 RepID=UPI003F70D75C